MVDAPKHKYIDLPLALLKAADGSGSYWAQFVRVDACQGVAFPDIKYGDTRGTRRQRGPRLSHGASTVIGIRIVSAIPASAQTDLLISAIRQPCHMHTVHYNVSNSFVLSKPVFVHAQHFKQELILLQESAKTPIADTAGFRAAFRLLCRANGQPARHYAC